MKQDASGIPHAILELAHRHEQRGEIHQALELYFRLLKGDRATPEATEAGRSVLGIARRLEAGGKRHLALSVYLKLADCLPSGREGRLIGSSLEETAVRAMEEQGSRFASHGKGRGPHPMEEIPFVDLTRSAEMRRNFERLGREARTEVELPQVVTQLRKLKR